MGIGITFFIFLAYFTSCYPPRISYRWNTIPILNPATLIPIPLPPLEPVPVPVPAPISQPSVTQSNDYKEDSSTTLRDESTIISPEFTTDFQIRESMEIALDSEIKDNTESISTFQTNNISKTLSARILKIWSLH